MAFGSQTAHAVGNTPDALDCGTAGKTWYSVSNVEKVKKITHAERFVNGSGSPITTRFDVERQISLSAGLKVTAGASASGRAVIANLQVQSGIELATSGSMTSKSAIGFNATIKPKKTAVIYRGYVQVQGTFRHYKCEKRGLVTLSRGTGKSYGVRETGIQRCDLKAHSAMAKLAKKRYC